jgi:predicted ArsR family transcriptional regulator
LEQIAAEFSPPAETIADFRGGLLAANNGADSEQIRALLRRRPCSVEGIASGLNISPSEAAKRLESLYATGLVQPCWTAGKLYYRTTPC